MTNDNVAATAAAFLPLPPDRSVDTRFRCLDFVDINVKGDPYTGLSEHLLQHYIDKTLTVIEANGMLSIVPINWRFAMWVLYFLPVMTFLAVLAVSAADLRATLVEIEDEDDRR